MCATCSTPLQVALSGSSFQQVQAAHALCYLIHVDQDAIIAAGSVLSLVVLLGHHPGLHRQQWVLCLAVDL